MNVSLRKAVEVSLWIVMWSAVLAVLLALQLSSIGAIPTFMVVPL